MKRTFIVSLLLLVYACGYGQVTGIADTANYLGDIKKELGKVWPSNRTINLVFHGHSVPAGYWSNHEVHTSESYPNLLLQQLKAMYPYAVINIIVTAIGGENAEKGCSRFEKEVLVHQPDVLFIDYALNDRKIGLAAAKKAWEEMIRMALKKNLKIVLLTPSPDLRVDIFAKDSNSLQVHAEQIRSLARLYHIGLADPFKTFQEIAKKTGSIREYMSHVNHPDKEGHQLIAEEILKWFKKDSAATSNVQSKAGLPQLSETNIQEIISLMTTEEKTLFVRGANGEGILPAGFSNAIPRLGIPAMAFTDGPAGVRITAKRKNDPSTYYCTAFPIETMLASSWDTALLRSVGEAMGNETREYGMDVLLAPALNIHRNPLGGRNFEYYSEDPLVSGRMAAATVNGIQSQGVGACIKHFAANNQETNRFKINAVISERAIRELYLQGFRITLQGSSPWTVMSSYNKINGVYTSERGDLLNTILRGEWGFSGFVMSDWRGGYDVVAQMKACNDLLMPGKRWQSGALDSSLKAGALDIKTLDSNIYRILKVLVGSPTFKKYKFSNAPDLKSHAALSREAAAGSMVLLKNKKNCLPFAEGVQTVALFGKTSYNLIAGGTGSGDVNKAYVISLEKGIRAGGYTIPESLISFYGTKKSIPEIALEKQFIIQQSKQSDIAIITLGRISGEGTDREKADFDLSITEKELITNVTAIYHQAGKKVIVVLNTGGVIETASWKDLPDAILLAWQPGQEGGYAISDILSGKVTPSGKLATSFPVKYTDVPSARNFPGTPEGKCDSVVHEEGIYIGYRYYDIFNIAPSFPFGYGLSYADFAYSDLQLSGKIFERELKVSVTIKNTGKRPGREIVQLYLGCPAVKLDKPRKELKGFAKTKLLHPGESEIVSFTLAASSLASFHPSIHAWIAEAGNYTVSIGSSSRAIRKSDSFQLAKELVTEKVQPALIPQGPIAEFKPAQK